MLLLSLITAASAGGWTQPQGDVYAKAWVRSLVGANAFLADGAIEELPDGYVDESLNLYAEGGLTDKWTLLGFATPVGYASATESTVYVGNIALGVRRALLTGAFNLAAEVRVGGAPGVGETSVADGTTDAGIAYVMIPTVRTFRTDAELQAGVGFGQGRGWFQASAGAAWHSRSTIDPAILGQLKGGWTFKRGLQPSLQIDVWMPVGAVDAVNVLGAGQTRYVGITPELSWWWSEHWSVNASFGSALMAQSNAAAPAVTAGVAWRGHPRAEAGGEAP
ncbi:MAG: hypothetical protein H6739_36910 [Alphaproteobacteria bacterium]|nr:hypothetical protein [Alphaproteobacteria bacterium]